MEGYDSYVDSKVRFGFDRTQDRKVDELIGIARGITADNKVNMNEAEFLISWLESNKSIINEYPGYILYDRIQEMLSDGVLDDDEKVELLGILNELTGEKVINNGVESMSTTLPLDNPMPDPIKIRDKHFCLTGAFAAGTRSQLQNVIKDMGGYIDKNITMKTDFLVIGLIGNENWKHSSHGLKIEKAVGCRDEKETGLSIVSEDHWIQFLINGHGD